MGNPSPRARPRRHRRLAHADRQPRRRAQPVVGPRALAVVGVLVAVLLAVGGRLGLGDRLDRSAQGLGSHPPLASTAAGADGVRQPPWSPFPSTGRTVATAAVGVERWRAVLEGLDGLRARAWRRGDPVLLRAIYTRQSTALALDRGMLLGYRHRGLRVEGVRLDFGRVEVLSRTPGAVRLRVVDRLRRMTAVTSGGVEQPLPRDRPTRHKLVLRLVGHEWRIADSDVV